MARGLLWLLLALTAAGSLGQEDHEQRAQTEATAQAQEREQMVSYDKLVKMIDETAAAANGTRRLSVLRELDKKRLVVEEEAIMSNKELRARSRNMTVAFDASTKENPEIHLVVMHNRTTVVAARYGTKYHYWESLQTASSVLIFLMIMIGNLSILFRLKNSCKRRRSNVNYFIVQLARADLLVGVFCVTLDLYLRKQKAFPFGLFACRAIKYVMALFIYSSVNVLVALTFDRWEVIVRPMNISKNRSRSFHLVAAAWLVGMLCALPVVFLTEIRDIDGYPQCWIHLDNFGWRIYMLYVEFFVLFGPGISISICYAQIVYTIWRKGHFIVRPNEPACPPHATPRRASAARAPKFSRRLPLAPSGQPSRPDDRGQRKASTRTRRTIRHIGPERANENQPTGDTRETSSLSSESVTDTSGVDAAQAGEEQPEENAVRTQQVELTSETTSGCEQVTDVELESRTPSWKQKRIDHRSVPEPPQAGAQQHGSGVIPKARIKTIKMTLVIVIAYILCWFPFCVLNLLAVFNMLENTNFNNALGTLTQSLAHLNSAVNPIIFWMFSSRRTNTSTIKRHPIGCCFWLGCRCDRLRQFKERPANGNG